MKKRFLNILVIGLFLFSLASCNDDGVDMIETEIEIENGKDFMSLSRLGGEYKIDIQTESNATWKASIDGILGYVASDDTMGVGSKTITLYTSTNRYDEDRTANLCITFPGYEASNQTISLKQMGKLSDPENEDHISVGNQIYAVGYGYDTRDKWANPTSVKAEILKTSDMIKSGKISAGPITISIETNVVTGSSVSELSNELNTSGKVSGSGWGFKGEAGAAFGMKDFSSNKYEYAIAYINFAKRSVEIKTAASNLRRYYMTPEAYDDINGICEEGEEAEYPSTASGFDKLISGYGTHLVVNAKLGGQIKYAMRMDVSQIKGSYDLEAYAKMNYKGVVNAEVSVSDELKKSYENNKSNIHTEITVLGGDDSATVLANPDSVAKFSTYLSKWIESLKQDENLALMDFEASDAMIPLYEMVDKTKYRARYEAMKEYMQTGRLESIKSVNMEYQCGTSTMIEGLPTFNGDSEKNTLIKDVYNEGQWVGRICNEYIPVINEKARVTVVYPVFSNTVKYNMGYFVGDSGHKPAKVCWQGENLTVTECPEDSIGAKMTLYLRGSDVSAVCYDNYVKGTIEDATVAAQGIDGIYNYSIVKIFNQIWMRENYKANHYTTGASINCSYHSDGTNYWFKDYAYYSYDEVVNDKLAPAGWRVTSKTDFLSIEEVLEKNGVTEISIAKAFFPDSKGGILGFHHWNSGWKNSLGFWNGGHTGYYGCLTNDGKKNYDGTAAIGADEKYEFSHGWDWSDAQRFTIRLVQDITQ